METVNLAREQRDLCMYGAVVPDLADVAVAQAFIRMCIRTGRLSAITVEMVLSRVAEPELDSLRCTCNRPGVMAAAFARVESLGLIELVGDIEDYRGETVTVWRVV